jgi:hypothetical protein
MTETIAATKLARFGLSADGANCLVEFEKPDGTTDRLSFPAEQLDEVVGLLLQVRQIREARSASESRSILVAEKVGVMVQPEAAVFDFVVGGAPISFAVTPTIAIQIMQIHKERLPATG